VLAVLLFLCVGGLLVALFWWGTRSEPNEDLASTFNPITGSGGVPMTDPLRGIEGPDVEDMARYGDLRPTETGAATPAWVASVISPGLPSKSALVADFEGACDEFRAALNGWLLDDRVSDKWTLLDLVGHLAAWLEEGARRIPQLLAGAPSKDYDAELFNDEAVHRARMHGPERVVERHSDAVEAFVDAVRRSPERFLAPEEGPGEWVRHAAAHYREHAAQLRAAAQTR
jgi:hypothetical protein